MSDNELSKYNFKMWLQDKCSTLSGTITDDFRNGAISAQYDPKRRVFILDHDHKVYSKAEVEQRNQNPKDFDLLIDKMLETNSGVAPGGDYY